MISTDPDLAAGRRLVARLSAATPVVSDVRLNRVDVTATGVRIDTPLLDDLLAASEHGHVVRITFVHESWTLTVNADPGSPIVLDRSGDTADVLSGQAHTDFEAAVARNDARSASTIAAATTDADVHVSVRNNPDATGYHWIQSAQELATLLTNSNWVATTNALTAGPTIVLVEDAADAHVKTALLDFVGPAATPTPAPVTQPRVLPTGPGNHEPNLAAPHLTGRPKAVYDPTGHLASLLPALHATTRRLAWARMATSAALHVDGTLELTISGARVVTVMVPSAPSPTDSTPDLDLYEWTFSADDLARHDSTVHAASLAILDDSDLPGAAIPTLRTARSLYQLARTGAVAEALATRRAAREAVQAAAKTAADTAREVAGKATERCLVQAGATVAVVLSNAGGLIGRAASYWLLALIALLGATSLLVAMFVQLKSGRDALAAGLKDIDEYQEAIPMSEIIEMRNRSESRSAAAADLCRAGWWTGIVYGFTLAAVVVAGIVLVHNHEPSNSKTPTKPAAAVLHRFTHGSGDVRGLDTTSSNSGTPHDLH